MATFSETLQNLSVQPEGSTNAALLMPKLQFRFRLTFEGLGTEDPSDPVILTRQVIDCSRPSVSFQKITLPIYNSTLYMAGKPTWTTMTINLRDDALGHVSRLIGSQLQKQMDFYEQSTAIAASDYKFMMYLEILDGGNGGYEVGVLERWELYGCFLETVNYNSVNYGTNEEIRIALTVSFDNALQVNTGGDNAGVTPEFLRGGNDGSENLATTIVS